jgi:hypothetical protein
MGKLVDFTLIKKKSKTFPNFLYKKWQNVLGKKKNTEIFHTKSILPNKS